MTRQKNKRLLATVALTAAIVFVGTASACAPKTADSSGDAQQGAAQDAAVTVSWTPDADCSACHVSEADSQTNSECAASFHASMACIDCHDDTDALSAAHEGVTSDDKTPDRLKKTEVDETFCISCHDDLAEKTADFTGLADENGTVVNPHDIPENADHDNVVCGDCHSMHDPEADALEDAKLKCVSCHHENVYECGTCHS